MKKLSIITILLITAVLILSGCSKQSGSASTDINKKVLVVNKLTAESLLSSSAPEKKYALEDLKQCTLSIDGMWCPSCSVGIEYAFKESEGVIDARIDVDEDLNGIGYVIYDPKLISPEDIVNKAEPFEAVVISNEPATALQL